MNRRNLWAWGITVLLLVACGCQPNRSGSMGPYQGKGPIRAVATVGMVGDLVRHVAKDRVTVHQIMGPGVDPHLYTPTRDDVLQMREAHIIFYSGLLLEGKMTDTLIQVGRSRPVYAVTDSIDPEFLLEPEGFGGHYDPHVWMDVSAWMQAVDAVAEALATFDPSRADDYRNNAETYKKTLEELHAYGQQALSTVPRESRILITSHDAFNYFGRAYDLEVLGVQGISTESEAGLQQINALVDTIVDRGVKAVFVESSVPRKNIEALVSGAQARGHQVIVGGELFSDAMGEAGTYEGTYVGMLDHNITVVTRALGGQAPPRGMQGKLSHEKSQ